VVERPQPAAPVAAAVVQRQIRFGARSPDFANFVRRGDHHRAERRDLAVVQSPPVHRHPEEARRAQRLDLGVQFLQMAADAFLPVIDAEDDLSLGPLLAPAPAPVIVGQGVEQRVPIMVLVGALPQRAPRGGGQGVQRFQQAFQIGRRQGAQLAAGNPEMLGQPE